MYSVFVTYSIECMIMACSLWKSEIILDFYFEIEYWVSLRLLQNLPSQTCDTADRPDVRIAAEKAGCLLTPVSEYIHGSEKCGGKRRARSRD